MNTYKKRIIVTAVVTALVTSAGTGSIRLRNILLAQMQTAETPDVTGTPVPGILSLPIPATSSASVDDVLGMSDAPSGTYTVPDYGGYEPLPTLPPVATPYPIPTSVPDTSTNTSSTNTSSSPDCGGVPTADNSQAYVSSSTTAVNVPVTISIELLDCHNQLASVNDTLVISQVSTDATARINGVAGPVTVKAKDGKASFTVNSQSTVTDTFAIMDTTRSFPVTAPGYRNPSVTFTSNTSGNSNCSTVTGVPNFWYSAVYPNPPISTTTGSMTLVVNIRDCNRNLVGSDTVTVSLLSGDPAVKVNGHALPYSLKTSNGAVSFTVTSGKTGDVSLKIHDDTSNFDVTDSSNHNPTITFGAAPTPVPAQTASPTPGPTVAAVATPVPTTAPTSVPASSPIPVASPTPEAN